MKIIKASYGIETPRDQFDGMLQRIEAAGRTCYKSEDRITDESARAELREILPIVFDDVGYISCP